MVRRTEGVTRGRSEHMLLLLFAVIAIAVIAAAVVTFGSDSSSAAISDDWSYDSNTKVLTYSGPASMPDYTASNNPITNLSADDAQSVVFVTDITKIGDCAFKGSYLHEITIPSDVRSIGRLSFGECYDLKTVTILSSNLRTIGEYAFASCSMLTSISMPSTVESIGSNAFFNCTSLKSIALPAYDSKYSERSVSIQERTFYGCTALESITIPEHVTDIGRYAFCNCTSLYSVTFQEEEIYDVDGEVIGYYSKISHIDDYAFKGCTSLKTIMIPDMLETIGTDIFKGTTHLESIETRGTNGHFRSSDGVLFDLGLSVLYHYPSAKYGSSYVIPASTVMIYTTAFDGAKGLTSLAIGQSDIFSTEDGVLFDADEKSLIRYPEGKTDYVYKIPDTVVEVRTNAFTGASNLETLVLSSSTITFRTESLCLGSFGNSTVLNIDAPDDYKIPENAYNMYTTLNYGGNGGNNTTILIIIIACVAVLLIVLAAVLIIRRRHV